MQLEQPSRAPCKQARDDLVGVESPAVGEGQRADSGDLLGRPGGQVRAELVNDCQIDALFDQSVEQPFQPLAPRWR